MALEPLEDVIAKLPNSLRVGVDVIPKMRLRLKDYIVCGVYFLFEGVKLQYVGQSRNIIARISQHYNAGMGLSFDSFTFIRCPLWHLDELELHCIETFKPPMNGQSPGGRARAERGIKASAEMPEPPVPPFVHPSISAIRHLGMADRMAFTVSEAGQIACVGTGAIKRAIAEGRLPCRKIGGRRLVVRDDLHEWLHSLPRERAENDSIP